MKLARLLPFLRAAGLPFTTVVALVALLSACGSPPVEGEECSGSGAFAPCDSIDAGTNTDGGAAEDGGVETADGGEDAGAKSEDGGVGDGGVTDGGVPVTGECSDAGFCWVNPLPHGNSLRAVWMASETDGWAVGSSATAYRWDGTNWTRWNPNDDLGTAEWSSVFGFASNDVWLASGGTVRHWNGTTLEAPLDVGCSGVSDLSGVASNDLWAVGGAPGFATAPCVSHWDGTAWTAQNLSGSLSLQKVHALPNGSVWAIGADVLSSSSAVYRRDSGAWSQLTGVGALGSIQNVWASADDDVWVIGTTGLHRFDGVSWTKVDTTPARGLWGLWGRGPNDVWIAGSDGRIGHFDGTAWTALQLDSEMYLFDLHGPPSGDTWVVGNSGTIARLTPSTATRVNAGFTTILHAVYDDGAGLWAAGEDGLMFRFDGQTWTEHRLGDEFQDFVGVDGTSANDVWAVTSWRKVFHFDGQSWSEHSTLSTTSNADALWVGGPGDVWILHLNGTLSRLNGGTWTTSTPSSAANAYWVNGPDDAWLVGDSGTIRRWDGTTWATVPSGTTKRLNAIWGIGSDLWATGDRIILRLGATGWRIVDEGDHVPILHALDGSSATDVWAAGRTGTAAHWDGVSWTYYGARETGANTWFNAVWHRGTDAWLLGHYGAVVQTP